MKKTLKQEIRKLIPNSRVETIQGKFYVRFELGGESNNERFNRIEQTTYRGFNFLNN